MEDTMEWVIAESTHTAYPSLLFFLAALGLPLLGALVAYFEDPKKPAPVRISKRVSGTRSMRQGGRR